ncbi:chemotaxis protein CheC [Bradyrhizobium sp. OAE829]|uniref:chemotaxis protein CheC n=1 Tax=Bradyrhizobium sp. OAE829 TaxID=2663807 RepID=UPI003394FDD4
MTAGSAELLSELQLDALTELVNIGVSRAASSLREMVGSQVHLSVPNVSLESRAGAIAILAEREISNLVAVHQVFEGDITGRALLIFPETKSLELVRAITGGDLPLEDIIELEQEKSIGGNRQYSSQQLPGDDCEHAPAQFENVASRSAPRQRRNLFQSRASSRGGRRRNVPVHQLCRP